MKRIAIVFLLVLVGGCAPEPALTITGATTMSPMLGEIAKRFEAKYPGTRIDVQTGGSSRGIADVTSGLADIGMSSRALQDPEQAGRKTWVVARDGVAFVVHKSNPVTALSPAQLRDIYTGKINDWQQVGGKQAPITVINRASGRSELTLVTKRFGIKPSDIDADLVAGETQQCIKLMNNEPNGIVYLSLGIALYETQKGAPLKVLPFEGVPATTENVRTGRYRFSRPLLLITTSAPSAKVREFLDFALSPDVHDLVHRYGFVPAK